MDKEVTCLSELVNFVTEIGAKSENLLVFRGEKKDYTETALVPFIYRTNSYINNEDNIYKESQRFNDKEFNTDKTVFDKLSRIQHYSAPTRLIDVSEDLFSSIFFSIAEKEIPELEKKDSESEEEFQNRKKASDKSDAIIYLFEIDKNKIKYYDSDTISVISNIAKIPLSNSINKSKSKTQLLSDIEKFRDNIEEFNNQDSVKFLMHEIREEKPQFEGIINPKHLTSVQFVYPKFTSDRVKIQKGAFLLFGLNPKDASKPIKIIDDCGNLIKPDSSTEHPVINIHRFILKYDTISSMKKELKSLGIRKPFIYPEIDKVSEYLVEKYKTA